MKNSIKFLSALIISGIALSTNAFAANPASFTMSTAASVNSGDTISVVIGENGTDVNVVTSKVTFSTTQLQFVSATCGSSFSGSQPETNGITCYTSGGTTVSGSITAATLVFKAIASSGTATISMASGSIIASTDVSGNDWNGAATSTSTAISTPAPSSPSAPSSGSGTTSGSTTSSNSTPTSSSSSSSSTSTTPSSSTAKSTTGASTSSSATSTTPAPTTTKTSTVKPIVAAKKSKTTPASSAFNTFMNSWTPVGLPLLLTVITSGGAWWYSSRK